MLRRLLRQKCLLLPSVVDQGVFEPGDRVVYTGYTKEQVRWGGNDCPTMLNIGETYIIESVRVHSQHTKVTLKGIVGRFNSVHFDHE